MTELIPANQQPTPDSEQILDALPADTVTNQAEVTVETPNKLDALHVSDIDKQVVNDTLATQIKNAFYESSRSQKEGREVQSAPYGQLAESFAKATRAGLGPQGEAGMATAEKMVTALTEGIAVMKEKAEKDPTEVLKYLKYRSNLNYIAESKGKKWGWEKVRSIMYDDLDYGKEKEWLDTEQEHLYGTARDHITEADFPKESSDVVGAKETNYQRTAADDYLKLLMHRKNLFRTHSAKESWQPPKEAQAIADQLLQNTHVNARKYGLRMGRTKFIGLDTQKAPQTEAQTVDALLADATVHLKPPAGEQSNAAKAARAFTIAASLKPKLKIELPTSEVAVLKQGFEMQREEGGQELINYTANIRPVMDHLAHTPVEEVKLEAATKKAQAAAQERKNLDERRVQEVTEAFRKQEQEGAERSANEAIYQYDASLVLATDIDKAVKIFMNQPEPDTTSPPVGPPEREMQLPKKVGVLLREAVIVLRDYEKTGGVAMKQKERQRLMKIFDNRATLNAVVTDEKPETMSIPLRTYEYWGKAGKLLDRLFADLKKKHWIEGGEEESSKRKKGNKPQTATS